MSDINDLKDRTIRNVERLDKHRVRLGELENHPIFKIWTSVRQGGKVTLDAILRGNRSVADLEKKLGNTRFLQKIPINLDLNAHLKYVDNIQRKVLEIDNRYISRGDHEKYEEQIAELRKNTNIWVQNHNTDLKELEETIILNTCREITKPYCPMRVADLDQIKENKKELTALRDDMANLMKSTSDVLLKEINELKERLKVNEIEKIPIIESVVIDHREVLREHIDQHWKIADADRDDLSIIHSWKGKLILLLEKLDSKTEKKEVCEACLYEETFDTKICAICIPNSNKSQFKPKDSGGEKPWYCVDCGNEIYLREEIDSLLCNPCSKLREKFPEPAIELLKIAKEVEKTKGYTKEKLPELNGTDDSMVYHPEQSTLKEKTEPTSEYKRGFTHGYEDGKKVMSKELIEEFIKKIGAWLDSNYSIYWLNLSEEYGEKLE